MEIKACASVLISFINIREKYFGSGAASLLQSFDLVIDATEIVSPGYPTKGFADFIDFPSIIEYKAEHELREFIQKVDIDQTFVVHPSIGKSSIELTRAIIRKSKYTACILFKSPVGNPLTLIAPWNIARFITLFLVNLYPFRKKLDLLISNNIIAYSPLLIRLGGFKAFAKVKHMDGVDLGDQARRATCKNKKIGVFIDQYLPFHLDALIMLKISINPDLFYCRLRKYLEWIIKRDALTELVVCLHPDSQGQELMYFEGYKTVRGGTKAEIIKASNVYSFYSNALGIAVQLNKPARALYFNDAMPLVIQDKVLRQARCLGIPVDFMDLNLTVSTIYPHRILSNVKKYLLTRYMAPGFPSPSVLAARRASGKAV